MRVLVVTSFNNGAVAPFIAEQVDAMRHAGVECDYYLVQGKGLRGYLRNHVPLQEKIQSFQPDIIHAHYGLCGLLANLQRKVPVITTFHGSDINCWWLRPFSLLAHWRSAHSIFVSDSLRRKLRVSRNRCTVLPCGVDTGLFQPCDRQAARRQLLLPPDQPLALFAGTYDDSVKDVALARAALQHQPQVRLVEPRGYSREQMALLFSAVDLLLVTSRSEGSPQVVKEALACNCPVVSVDVGDVARQIADINGCSIVARRPETIADGITNVLLQQRCTEGRQRILSQQLDNDSVARRLLYIYHNAISHPDLCLVDIAQDGLPPQLANQWDDLSRNAATATVFQSRHFFEFAKTLDCWEPFAYGVMADNVLKGVIAGVIQREGGAARRFFSRRAIVNGGPLLSDDIEPETVAFLLRECKEKLRRKAIYIEIRNLHDYTSHRSAIAAAGFDFEPHYNFQLDIDNDPTRHYHKGKRKELRIAARYGVKVTWEPTIDQIREFHRLLQRLYTTKVHTPLPPWDFFESAYRQAFLHYAIALTPDGAVAGGQLVADLDTRASYAWYCCSDDSLRHMKVGTVLIDAALHRCADLGIGCFDFMGAGRPGDGGYGVRDFKAQFGGTLVEQGRFRCILNQPLYRLGCAVISLLRKKR